MPDARRNGNGFKNTKTVQYTFDSCLITFLYNHDVILETDIAVFRNLNVDVVSSESFG